MIYRNDAYKTRRNYETTIYSMIIIKAGSKTTPPAFLVLPTQILSGIIFTIFFPLVCCYQVTIYIQVQTQHSP